MLKVSYPSEVFQFEATTLTTWAGHGAVLMLERDDANYAMLLEKLHQEPLTTVADSDEAMTIVGRLARRLAVPAPPGPPRMGPIFEQWGFRTQTRAVQASLRSSGAANDGGVHDWIATA